MSQVEKNNMFYTSPNVLELLEPNNITLNNFIYKEIFEYQVYNNIPEMLIKNNDVVIDVGAHIGIFSRYAAIRGSSRVIAMEMEPKHFSCLKLNVRSEDDIFNCVLFNKLFTKFKLENDLLIVGFTLDYFYEGSLFEKIDFLKIDISGKELILLNSISQNVFDVIKKISIKMYNLSNEDKYIVIKSMKNKGFSNSFNIITSNKNIQFLYFWK
jgi:hypothetical protein